MSLFSLQFFSLSLATILWMRMVRGAPRGVGLALASLVFIHSYVGATGTAVAIGFSLGGYLVAAAAARNARVLPWGVAALTLAFVFVQAYSFLSWFLPDEWILKTLATAGLSFLFFKIIHVIVDLSSGTIKELSLGLYLIYCFNFTAFLLGPIQRFQEFDEQWRGEVEPLAAEFEPHLDAVLRILVGLVKKFVVAGYVAPLALLPGAGIDDLGLVRIVAGIYLFYLYLYLDFSGYCDIVIGIGALMGIRPPENFNLPFFSPNVAQFWLRVHRTLTTWLTDYVFNPLFAALLRAERWKVGLLSATSIAMMATMLVSGLWHGTTMNFVLFGLVHGILLTVFRLYESIMQKRLGRKGLRSLRQKFSYRIPATALTFATTGFAYVFFVLDIDQLTVLWSKAAGLMAS